MIKRLTLLHSNDMHGDFTAEQIDEQLVGGISYLSGYVQKIREEEPNTVYCIAGDMFRGSIIDSEFKGLSTIEIMNALAPDVVSLGNHETDYGIAHLLFLEKCAQFPIINANLYIKSNQVRLFRPHVILEIDGMKLLFIGILTEEVITQTKKEAVIGSFVDIHDAAKEVGRICNAYNATDVDLTVILTHIGFEEDKQLAAMLDPAWGVDVIIGGHSHTFLEQPEMINGILISQAGTGTDQIGRFDLEIDTENNCLVNYTWKSITINSDNCPEDVDIKNRILSYQNETDKKYKRILTRFKRTLSHPDRNQETELGGLFSDILKESLGVDIVLMGSGGIRKLEMGPQVLVQDLIECIPYNDPVYMLKVNGKQFGHMMRHMLRDEVWQGVSNEFYQLSKGIKVVYDIPNKRLIELTWNGEPVEDEQMITIGLEKFHYLNFSEFFDLSIEEVRSNQKERIVATSERDIIEEYLIEHPHLDHQIDGRLTLIK